MKQDNSELEYELLPEYDLKSLRVRKLGSGRKSFGSGIVRLEPNLAEMFPTSDASLRFASSKLSEAAFSKVWDNPEDAAYDNL
jgi:hypothetical protein